MRICREKIASTQPVLRGTFVFRIESGDSDESVLNELVDDLKSIGAVTFAIIFVIRILDIHSPPDDVGPET